MEPFLCLDRLFIMRKFFVMWEGGLKTLWILSHVPIHSESFLTNCIYIHRFFFEVLAGYLASEAPNYRLRSRKEIARKLRITIGNQEKFEKDSDWVLDIEHWFGNLTSCTNLEILTILLLTNGWWIRRRQVSTARFYIVLGTPTIALLRLLICHIDLFLIILSRKG